MQFQNALIPAKLVRRYKRFLSDHELADGTVITAHCANPGAMTGLQPQGADTWLSISDNPKRKLKYSWELVRADGVIVGINTSLPNGLVLEALQANQIKELSGYDDIRREVKYGENSRIDMLLRGNGRADCYLEVKNVHLMRRPGLAEFPDSVTVRGSKHLRELANMVQQGHRAVMLYLVQRSDCEAFTVAADIDKVYAETLEMAREKGVETLCYACQLSEQEINLRSSLPVLRAATDWGR